MPATPAPPGPPRANGTADPAAPACAATNTAGGRIVSAGLGVRTGAMVHMRPLGCHALCAAWGPAPAAPTASEAPAAQSPSAQACQGRAFQGQDRVRTGRSRRVARGKHQGGVGRSTSSARDSRQLKQVKSGERRQAGRRLRTWGHVRAAHVKETAGGKAGDRRTQPAPAACAVRGWQL